MLGGERLLLVVPDERTQQQRGCGRHPVIVGAGAAPRRPDGIGLRRGRLVVPAHRHAAGPGGPLELVGVLLLERTVGPGLRAPACLPRTDVTAMVAAQAPVVAEVDVDDEPEAGAVRS